MNMKKIVVSASALALTAAVAVGGTLAWLQTSTNPIKNTFTAGKNIAITLDERKIGGEPNERVSTDQQYEAYPGAVLDKDPTIHVAQDSGECYVFAKVDNTFGLDTATIDMVTQVPEGEGGYWTLVKDETNVYYYTYKDAEGNSSSVMQGGSDAVVFNHVTILNSVTDVSKINNSSITVTGYAVQVENFEDANAAWVASGF